MHAPLIENRNYLTFKCHGKEFKLIFSNKNDHIARIISSTRNFYEIDILDYLLKMNIRGEHAIDVGANIGNHAIYFSNFIAQNVIAIEANPQLSSILEENLKENTNCYELIAKGVGENPGFVGIEFPQKNNIGAGKLTKRMGCIPLVTLDEISPKSGVFLVKIDVEGMEIEVLRGATKLLKEQHPHLIIEAATALEFRDISTFLSQYGYTPLSQWNATPTYHFSHRPKFLQRYHAKLLKIKYRINRFFHRHFL